MVSVIVPPFAALGPPQDRAVKQASAKAQLDVQKQLMSFGTLTFPWG